MFIRKSKRTTNRNRMTTISYAITACNEYKELTTLLSKITSYCKIDDEIVVLLDSNNCSSDVEGLCEEYKVLENFHLYYHPLNKDFASHKNHLNSLCSKDWIFNIDADEVPSDELLSSLKEIIDLNKDTVDLIAIPRVNIVNGLTQEHITKWGWMVDEKQRVNWPDYQMRLYKNTSTIKWVGKVHERPEGWLAGTHIPPDLDELALLHVKDIVKQEKQNALYNTI